MSVCSIHKVYLVVFIVCKIWLELFSSFDNTKFSYFVMHIHGHWGMLTPWILNHIAGTSKRQSLPRKTSYDIQSVKSIPIYGCDVDKKTGRLLRPSTFDESKPPPFQLTVSEPYDVWMEAKREDTQNCCMLCCIWQLCTMIHTQRCTVLKCACSL